MTERSERIRAGAVAGASAALVWAAQQPIDKGLFASDYDDVELLGKLVTRDASWPVIGVVMHAANGAMFGAAYGLMRDRLPGPPWARGLLLAQLENFGLWPLVRFTDRFHPARRELPKLRGSRRALAQATWRHAVFGLILGPSEARARRAAGRDCL